MDGGAFFQARNNACVSIAMCLIQYASKAQRLIWADILQVRNERIDFLFFSLEHYKHPNARASSEQVTRSFFPIPAVTLARLRLILLIGGVGSSWRWCFSFRRFLSYQR